MSALIESFERLEATRAETVSWVDQRVERYRTKPDPECWSYCQVMNHVMNSEEGSLSYVKKKLGDPSTLTRAGLRNSIRSVMLSIALRSPFRFRAPAVLPPPSNDLEWDEQRARWEEIRVEWRGILEKYPAELLGAEIFRHPVAGRITIGQTLVFMQEHLDHHRRQLRRVEARLA